MTDLSKAQHLSGLSAIMEELNQKRQKVNSFYVKFLKEEFFTFVMIETFFITTNQILEVTKMEFTVPYIKQITALFHCYF